MAGAGDRSAPTGNPMAGPRGGILSANTATTPAVGTMNVIFEAGAIVQQPREDGEHLAERVAEALRQRSLAQSGDSLNFTLV